MDDILQFPLSTFVDRSIPKTAFYTRMDAVSLMSLTAFMQALTDEFETIVWRCGEAERLRQVDPADFHIEGSSMNAVYDHFLSRVSGLPIASAADYEAKTAIRAEAEKLRRECERLRRKIRNERQLNREMEIRSNLRTIESQLTDAERRLGEPLNPK